jgi:vacuolar-type H+-ATPase subunit F/Vma7
LDETAKRQNDALAAKDGGPHKRTRLNEALEKARQKKVTAVNKKTAAAQTKKVPSDDEWVEEDDAESDEENYCNHDITLDLNEPHSQSGRYWKEEFEKYHKDAKAEMEKLLKYKQLAKSYAQMKDAEAIELAEKLKDEQQKVIMMEQKIAENASNIIARHENTSEEASPELVAKLTKQTALAVQYRQRVQELEDQLENFLQGKQDEADSKNRRRRQTAASPRTQKTLVETQRELRRAKLQVREVNTLREQVFSLEEQLRAAEKRAAKAEARATLQDTEPSTATDLRAQLRAAREESRKKDEEIQQLKKDFQAFRMECQTRQEDTNSVLERAHTKIADLKKEVKMLRAGASELKQDRHQLNPEDEEPAARLATRTRDISGKDSRRSPEKAPLQERNLPNLARHSDEHLQSLRDKYRHGTTDALAQSREPKTMSGALADRPELERPKWQPFVPRSPRNKAHLGKDTSHRIENGGLMPAGAMSKDIGVGDLSTLAKRISHADKPQEVEPEHDELRSRFVRLGNAGVSDRHNNSTAIGNTSKSRLPPARRAAAMARIEQRRAEKLREQARGGLDKENVHP